MVKTERQQGHKLAVVLSWAEKHDCPRMTSTVSNNIGSTPHTKLLAALNLIYFFMKKTEHWNPIDILWKKKLKMHVLWCLFFPKTVHFFNDSL